MLFFLLLPGLQVGHWPLLEAAIVPAPAANDPTPAAHVPAPAANDPAPASNVPAPAAGYHPFALRSQVPSQTTTTATSVISTVSSPAMASTTIGLVAVPVDRSRPYSGQLPAIIVSAEAAGDHVTTAGDHVTAAGDHVIIADEAAGDHVPGLPQVPEDQVYKIGPAQAVPLLLRIFSLLDSADVNLK